jgi:hypothetical protein
MDLGSTLGRMGECMKEITRMIKNTDLGSTHGQMAGNIRATGLVESNTV